MKREVSVSSLIAGMALCVTIGFMLVSIHQSLHKSLGRMEQQLTSLEAHLEAQEQILFIHTTDTRLQLAQMAMNSLVRYPRDESSVQSDTESE